MAQGNSSGKDGTGTAVAKPRTSYEKWQDTVDIGITDTRWDQYDATIRMIVAEYNLRLGKKSCHVEKPMLPLDWKWIKAMV